MTRAKTVKADEKPVRARGRAPAGEAAPATSKLVRDSFTIPKHEYLVLAGLKERAAQLRRPVKKSELLRAGIAALEAMGDRSFLAALARVPSLKTGRPREADAAAAGGAGR